MRALLLCTDAYGGHGGIALYNRDLAEAIAARPDCEEVLVLPRVVHEEVRELPPKITLLADAARGPVRYMRALNYARRRRPELVICGHVNLLPVACTLASSPLLMIYGIEAWRALPAPKRRLLDRCAVVSISAITRDRFLGWSQFQGATHLLPNAIHLEKYGLSSKSSRLLQQYSAEGKRVLLTVGRLDARERYKGFDEVMETLPALPDDVIYLIAGGGSDLGRLKEKAVRLGVADRVRFTGVFDEAEKREIFGLADVYVMPSRGEGFGYVFLEALASGVPAVGSRLDGGREALRDGELGLLVDPFNLTELAQAIREQLARNMHVIPAGLDYFSYANFVARAGKIVDDALR